MGLLPLLFFMTLVPDLGKMAKFSICAQMANLIAFLVVFWFDFEHLHLFQAIKDRDEINVAGLAGFFSVAIYCYEVRFLLFCFLGQNLSILATVIQVVKSIYPKHHPFLSLNLNLSTLRSLIQGEVLIKG